MLTIREEALGPEHPGTATSLNNLALLYAAEGRYAGAEPLNQRALAIWEKTLGPAHPDVALSLNNLAELYRAQGRYAEVEPLHQRARADCNRGQAVDQSLACTAKETGEPTKPYSAGSCHQAWGG